MLLNPNQQGGQEVVEYTENFPSTDNEDEFRSFGFEWEQTFGKLSNERLEHLQRIIKEKEVGPVHALSTSTGLNTIGLHRQSFMKSKRVGSLIEIINVYLFFIVNLVME